MNEGFRIRSTIDVDLQKAAEDSLRTHLEQSSSGLIITIKLMLPTQPHSKRPRRTPPCQISHARVFAGAIIAWINAAAISCVVVRRDLRHNQYNRGPASALDTAGTAMLPFVYAAAFEKGMYPGSLVEDSPLDNRAVMIGARQESLANGPGKF